MSAVTTLLMSRIAKKLTNSMTSRRCVKTGPSAVMVWKKRSVCAKRRKLPTQKHAVSAAKTHARSGRRRSAFRVASTRGASSVVRGAGEGTAPVSLTPGGPRCR